MRDNASSTSKLVPQLVTNPLGYEHEFSLVGIKVHDVRNVEIYPGDVRACVLVVSVNGVSHPASAQAKTGMMVVEFDPAILLQP